MRRALVSHLSISFFSHYAILPVVTVLVPLIAPLEKLMTPLKESICQYPSFSTLGS